MDTTVDVSGAVARARAILARMNEGALTHVVDDQALPDVALQLPDAIVEMVQKGAVTAIARKYAIATGGGNDRLWLAGDAGVPTGVVVQLGAGVPVELHEFDQRFLEHHVSTEVRKRLWPRAKRLVLHPIVKMETIAGATVEIEDDLLEDAVVPALPATGDPAPDAPADNAVPEDGAGGDAPIDVAKSFAGFSSFSECVLTQTRGGYPVESARRICGALMRDLEKADVDAFEKAKWSTAFINGLPDENFLYVEAGGKKDDEGKTVPRSLRHFPYKDKAGKVDVPHLRNAISRIPQASAPGLTTDKKKELQDKARKLLAKPMKKHAVKIVKAEADVVDGEGEERFILGVVLEPDVVDSQGDTYSAVEVRKTAHRWMEESGDLGYMHKVVVGGFKAGALRVLESYLAPTVFTADDGTEVKKGSWLLGSRVADDDLWAKVQKGEITGYSIGGDAAHEVVPPDEAAQIPDATPTGK